jgi:serine/threonine protein kinase
MAFDGPLIGGRFRLGPRLGKGSQAETFVARDEQPPSPASPREVVVKRLKLSGSWKQFDLLEREAKVLGQLRHPGIPRYLATIEEPAGTFNLVMERMPGEDLRALSARRRLSTLELRDILVRGLEVLDYLHTRTPPVVHRDIKPSNLVRAPDGKIAVVDFGGVLDAARERGGSTMVGTFGYMAPEQLHGQAMAATDIYALGATIVALAGGIEPEDVPRKGLRMDLDRHLPSLDPDLRAALTAMTAPDPDQRPQRARDVVDLLGKAPPPRTVRKPDKAIARAGRREVASARPPPKLFAEIQEPLGALLRLSVLIFAGGGWFAMMWIRFAVFVVGMIGSVIAFPARHQIRGVRRDVDHLLNDGQQGFGDLARRAIARDHAELPPGDADR